MKRVKIRAVIFDLNDVLVTDGWRIAVSRLTKKLGYNQVDRLYDNELKLWKKNWKKVYKGIIDEDEIYRQITAVVSQDKKRLILAAFNNYGKYSCINKPVLKIARRLYQQGLSLSILTNSLLSWYLKWDSFLKDLKIFHKIFVSCKIGAMKPEKKCFKIIRDSLRVPESNCLVIDDRRKNIQAAKRIGMKAILYTNIKDIKKKLTSWKMI